MSDLTVIIPSRGRPGAVAAIAETYAETCELDTWLVFAVDDNDPDLDRYRSAVVDAAYPNCSVYVDRNKSMVEALNHAVANTPLEFAVGFQGDDHRPRTKGWDAAYVAALRELGTGIVYGNDLLQGSNLPTQCAMTADIPAVLGYMAPPSLTHLAVDNFWLELGQGAACIRYLPSVVVEHMHPVAGKADWDEGYQRVNHPRMYDRDLHELTRLRGSSTPVAIARVSALRGAHHD